MDTYTDDIKAAARAYVEGRGETDVYVDDEQRIFTLAVDAIKAYAQVTGDSFIGAADCVIEMVEALPDADKKHI